MEQFIKSALGSRFQKCKHFTWKNRVRYYLCVQPMFIKGELIKTIVLDSFSVTHEKYLGGGNLKEILDEVERIADKIQLPIYINSVLTPRLGSFLVRRGYIPDGNSIPSYYRKTRSS